MSLSKEEREKIVERQKEGRELFYPAKILALERGRRHSKKHGAIMVFQDLSSGLVIRYDTYAPNMTVNYKEKWVLNFHLGSINRYIPGEWVDLLKGLSAPVIMEMRAKELKEKEESRNKRLEEWGLDEPW